jgi:hypothetical protein
MEVTQTPQDRKNTKVDDTIDNCIIRRSSVHQPIQGCHHFTHFLKFLNVFHKAAKFFIMQCSCA